MPTIRKELVLQKIKALQDAIGLLRDCSTDSIEYKKWRHDVQALLRNAFGPASPQLKNFDDISFSPMVLSIGSDNSRAFRQSYIQGLGSSQALLAALTEEVNDYWPAPEADESRQVVVSKGDPVLVAHPENVFVVHGRNSLAREGLFTFLRSIKLCPMEWSQAVALTNNPLPYIGEVLDAAFGAAQAVVVLFTPDELACLRPEFCRHNDPPHESSPSPQSRPNVLFEAGMAAGRCPKRTVMVQLGELRPFSDIAGLHVLRLSNDSAARQQLAQRLGMAGCPVDLSGVDWHTAGNLSPELSNARQPGSLPVNGGGVASKSPGPWH